MKNGYSAYDASEELGHCKINILTTKNEQISNATITKMTPKETEIVKSIGYEAVGSMKEVKELLKMLKRI